jgi:hypothetical protein
MVVSPCGVRVETLDGQGVDTLCWGKPSHCYRSVWVRGSYLLSAGTALAHLATSIPDCFPEQLPPSLLEMTLLRQENCTAAKVVLLTY